MWPGSRGAGTGGSTQDGMTLESGSLTFRLPNGSAMSVKIDVVPHVVYPGDSVRVSFVLPDFSRSKNVKRGMTWGFLFRSILSLLNIGGMKKRDCRGLARKC